MPKCKEKSEISGAIQISWKNLDKVRYFLGDIINEKNPIRKVGTYSKTCGEKGPYIEFTVQSPPSLHGNFIIRHGDHIIKTKNEKYSYFIMEVKNAM